MANADYAHGDQNRKRTSWSDPAGLRRVIENGRQGDSLGKGGPAQGGYADLDKPRKEK
jgi:hypothetical protein